VSSYILYASQCILMFDLSAELASREEEDAEEDTRRAQLTLHEVQRLLDRYKTLVELLQQGDYALVNAAHHLSAADSKAGSGVDGECSNLHATILRWCL
jgi:hypothetical protein